MKKATILSLVFVIGIFSSCSVKNLVKAPSAIESALAVKEILNSSAFKAFKLLGSDSPAIPKEMDAVLKAMNTLGYGQEVDKVKSAVTDASRIASVEGEAIMKDAIKEVDFKDAAKIVVTGGNAATGVLKKAMYTTVTKRYSDRLDAEFEKQDVNKYWPLAASAYNVFAKEKVDTKMSDFVAKRAVDAAFLGMGVQEKDTRKDYKKVGKKVVTKVFDYYKDKKLDKKGKIVKM